jgi:hypothetical protein
MAAILEVYRESHLGLYYVVVGLSHDSNFMAAILEVYRHLA